MNQKNEPYRQYVENVCKVIEDHGGRHLVRTGRVTPVSGDWNPERIIVIEFETAEQLDQCFQSPEYLELAPFREHSAISKSIIVEEYDPDS
ncbi:MAG: DUF1330 domain-containing protein [Deltaproteobacteria bacterium]|nr:DUF1330 domain-containing protein [Deltaproteobacteria bacterium]MBW2051777.1 DUF1330 domain-containing protein [Deltaproteobacteria bacterium]MBW2140623.1 DUF1330 domain-containing protein [Deltaproteobacteria bacterium]MBW2323314.1 DUF1330 domain-containing protein [Deltaproteobacteria bacterium]